MTPRELEQRTKQFALRCLRLSDALPKTSAGRAIGNQLARSGPSVGANYRAATRARSKAEWLSKISIVCEEIDESAYWLELIMEGNILKSPLVEPLHHEAMELVAIFSRSRKTARSQIAKSPNLPITK